jgi:hypothetical protein
MLPAADCGLSAMAKAASTNAEDKADEILSDDLRDMIELCRDGPPGAHVTAIDQREAGAVDLALRSPGDLFSVLAGS